MRWEISGGIVVHEDMTPGRDQRRPLSNVRYEVSTSTLKNGGWKKIKNGFTDDDGKYSFNWNAKNDKSRRFRTRVFFQNDKLKIRPWRFLGSEPKPYSTIDTPAYLVHKDTQKREPGTEVYLGGGFSTIPRNIVPAETDKRQDRMALLWYIASTLQKELESLDPWLGFNKRLNIIYPAGTHTYAGGNTVHLKPKHFKLSTIIHEIMHIWNYQHNHGTTNWICAWGGTHGRQEPANIAFHEGFASWAAEEIITELWRETRITGQTPYHRFYLYEQDKLADLDELERNDLGVASALRMLTSPEYFRMRFGTSDSRIRDNSKHVDIISERDFGNLKCQNAPNFSIWELLLVFRADPDRGWKKNWEVGRKSYGIRRFYDRVSDFYPKRFSNRKHEAFLRVLDPAGDEEPQWSCRAISNKGRKWLDPDANYPQKTDVALSTNEPGNGAKEE